MVEKAKRDYLSRLASKFLTVPQFNKIVQLKWDLKIRWFFY